MHHAVPSSTSRRRSRLVILDYIFYVAFALAICAFCYYIYTFRNTALLILPFLLQGAGVTIAISLISMILATIFGLLAALGCLSRFKLVRLIATLYVELVRGTPLLVQLSMWYFGIGLFLARLGFSPYATAFQIMTVLQNNSLVPDMFNGIFYGIIALSFNYGAYLTEIFRSGILSVDKGQYEAALSLGLNEGQVMRRIIIPQAIRIIIPPFTNNFITLIQDSSLLATLSVIELEQQTFALAFPLLDSNTKLFVFVLGALFYLIICYPLSRLTRYLETRMAVAY
ncbi:amino acid ABC transporter permease [Ktedonosporobacter rubrisoli]|uniref:Amino acid ABC transporter permease n=1 Tax=Ktedonosporobacter rubrisoli TaxID=2509675 RepID=A0A4P6K2U5_KTERU|nr:amino acid ABC transporter permease [Ktedonosporobacter rubrisoli]QBD81806.1 amino acid ABC transporter permease [Ktedonosporobacter rubrisoli]